MLETDWHLIIYILIIIIKGHDWLKRGNINNILIPETYNYEYMGI